MPRLFQNNFSGLLLPLDPRRVVNQFAFEGENFIPAIDGIKSEFGARQLLFETENQPGMRDTIGATTINFPNDNATYFCNRNGIFILDLPLNRLIPVFLLPESLDGIYKWTFAEINRVQYFARRGSPLISHDLRTNTWRSYSDDELFPGIIACCEIGGRLFLTTERVVAWSAIDDGEDFVTSTVTGAGFQSLSIIRVDDAESVITCLPYEQGVITYTRSGFLRSQLVEDVNPFRHRPVYKDYEMPLSDFAVIAYTENTHLWLALRGFYAHDGVNPPQFWQPLMSEYLRGLSEQIPISLFNRIRLHYAPVKGWLTVSIEEADQITGSFSLCYVYVIITDGWGVFNRPHTGFHEFQLVPAQLTLCYTTALDNALFQLIDEPFLYSIEQLSTMDKQHLFLGIGTRDDRQLINEYEDGQRVMIWAEDLVFDGFVNIARPRLSRALYNRFGAINPNPRTHHDYNLYELPRLGLDSNIGLGLFRLPDDRDAQPITTLDEFIVSTDVQLRPRDDHEDWAAGDTDVFIDYAVHPIGQEFIDDALALVDTQATTEVTVISSLDGEFTRQQEAARPAYLDERHSTRKALLYRVESSGVYHSLHFFANEPGASFYVRAVDCNFRYSGIHP